MANKRRITSQLNWEPLPADELVEGTRATAEQTATGRDTTERDTTGSTAVEGTAVERTAVERTAAGRDAAKRDAAGRTAAGRDAAKRDAAGRDAAGRTAVERTAVEGFADNADGLVLHGDCISACAELARRGICVDTVYIDPPFASSSNYNRPVYLRPPVGNVLPTSTKLSPAYMETVFTDALEPEEFIAWLEPQIRAIHHILSPCGSFFLHLDHHISHYAKVLLDSVFGHDNFRNEIIWSYRTGGVSKRTFAKKHDVIFFYSKGDSYRFFPQYYRSYQAKQYNYNPKYPELWDEDAQRWYHLAICRDVWDDINVIGTEREGSERLDYPTQKPEALLERIIAATTTEGHIVADFFGGSGVSSAVAQRMKRRFVHGDISHISVATCRNRLQRLGATFEVRELTTREQISAARDAMGAVSWRFSLQTPAGHPEPPIAKKAVPHDALEAPSRFHATPATPSGWQDSETSLQGAVQPTEAEQLELDLDSEYSAPGDSAPGDSAPGDSAPGDSAPSDTATAYRLELQQYHNPDLVDKLGEIGSNGLESVEWISVDCTADSGTWHSDAEVYIDPFGRAWSSAEFRAWDGILTCPTPPRRLRIRDISGRDTLGKLERNAQNLQYRDKSRRDTASNSKH